MLLTLVPIVMKTLAPAIETKLATNAYSIAVAPAASLIDRMELQIALTSLRVHWIRPKGVKNTGSMTLEY
jgi:hypothetical protein